MTRQYLSWHDTTWHGMNLHGMTRQGMRGHHLSPQRQGRRTSQERWVEFLNMICHFRPQRQGRKTQKSKFNIFIWKSIQNENKTSYYVNSNHHSFTSTTHSLLQSQWWRPWVSTHFTWVSISGFKLFTLTFSKLWDWMIPLLFQQIIMIPWNTA